MFEINNFVAAGKFFLILAGELVLIFVAVSFLVGLLTEHLPPSRIRDFLSNKMKGVQYILGAGLGSITPFCSCSTVPITAGLLKGGVPFGPIMAFLFASPVLNPVIVALVLSLLGIKVAAVYVLVTFIGSMTMAAVLARFGMEAQVKPFLNTQSACCADEAPSTAPLLPIEPMAPHGSSGNAPLRELPMLPVFQNPAGCCVEEMSPRIAQAGAASCCTVNLEERLPGQTPFAEKMKRAAASAVETFKGVFWYLLLGAAIGAFIYGFFPQDLVVKWAGPDNPWSIPIAALMGVPMYIRAETVIPISAALVGKGMGVGAVLALIIGGAGASIPEIIILASMFKKKLILAFIVNVFLVAIIGGYLITLLLY